jgi:AraC-like DNA-binding protein
LVNLAFSTQDVAPAERLAAWRELVSRAFIPLEITPLGQPALAGVPGDYEASATSFDLGELRVWRVVAGPMSAERAARHIRPSAAGDYLLALHARGTAHATQDGRRVVLEPGDLALFDSSRPYSIAFHADGQFEHIIFQIPRPSLDARHRDAGKATALRVPATSGPGQLASPYLRTMATSRWPAAGAAPAQPFVDAGLDLVVGALRAAAGSRDELGLRRQALLGEMKRYALAHLGDPGLSPERVAGASYVSVRQLHRLFASEGLSFSAWAREARLRRCRADLADQDLRDLAIAEVARRWGYRSAAHFTRAFAARFGTTPREFRRTRARRPDAVPGQEPARAELAT